MPRQRPLFAWFALATALLALILVPFGLFGAAMDAWAVATVEAPNITTTLIALLVIALLAGDVLLPVPSSILSTVSGALLGLPLGAAASFIGMTLGCVVGYAIGKSAGRSATERLVGATEVRKLEALTARHGDWSIAVSRAVPVLAEASVIMAGVGAMRFKRFLLITCFSNLGISVAYAAVGATSANMSSFFLALGGAVLIPLAALLIMRIFGKRRTAQRSC